MWRALSGGLGIKQHHGAQSPETLVRVLAGPERRRCWCDSIFALVCERVACSGGDGSCSVFAGAAEVQLFSTALPDTKNSNAISIGPPFTLKLKVQFETIHGKKRQLSCNV